MTIVWERGNGCFADSRFTYNDWGNAYMGTRWYQEIGVRAKQITIQGRIM
ncbi:MAG: hypothetical protein ACLTZT_15600 [Butyricimonas faecalis]